MVVVREVRERRPLVFELDGWDERWRANLDLTIANSVPAQTN